MKIRDIKKAQQEIVGFVLIVVIIVVIGLFLLVFYLKQPAVGSESLDVQNFLRASMMYTTECFESIEPLSLEDLIKSCYKNDACLNEKMACKILNDTLSEITHESWLVSPQKPVNAYSILIYYEESSFLEEPSLEKKLREENEEGSEKEETLEEDEEAGKIRQEILRVKEGNCTGAKTGATHSIPNYPGDIIINMEICYT